jgi:PKD domain
VIAAASAAAPAAAGAAGILVRLPGGAARHLSPDEVSAAVDRPAGTCLLRAPGTAAEPVAHPPALSVRRLVTLAGASPDAVSFVSIERPNGSLSLLGRGDLTDPPPFPDGPPLVWMDAGGARYLRPLRGPDDANGADNVDITGGDLVVTIHQGPLLVVRARADRRAVRAGTVVHFAAEIVSGAGQGLSYAWRFGDGATASGPAAGHAFAAPGTYEAVVTVDGTDDSGGSSAPLRIRVGRPPPAGGAVGGGSGDRRRSPAQGPARGSGGAGGGRPGGSGAAGASGSPSSGAGGSAAAGASGSPSSGASRSAALPRAAPAPAAPPAATTRAPAPAPRATTPAPAPPRAAAPRTRRPRPRRARAGRRPAARATPPGRLVRGTLVAARVAAVLPGASPPPAAAAPARAAAARRGTDPRRDPLAPAAGILVAIALVGLGARRERRAVRPPPEVR